MSIGISKRELMEDYYLDEIGVIFEEWNIIHDPDHGEATEENVSPLAFFGIGGDGGGH